MNMKKNCKPIVQNLFFFEPPVLNTWKINDQISVNILPHDGDFIQIILFLPIGKKHETKLLQSTFTGYMFLEGTRKLKSHEIAFQLDKLASEIEIYTSFDYTTFVVATIKNNIVQVMDLFFECLFDPAFPEQQLNILLQQHRQDFLIKIRKPMFKARTLFPAMLFGQTLPAFTPLTEKDFLQINVSDLQEFYRFFPWNNIQIFATGNLSAIQKINFGSLINVLSPNFTISEPVLNFKPFTEKEITEFVPESAQSAIIVGKPTITFNHPDFPAVYFLNTVLGGYFGSRLMKNIRETKGYTYSIYSDITSYRDLAYWAIYTTVNKDKTREVIDEIFHEIQRLLTKKVSLKEIEKVKNYLKGQYLSNFENEFTTTQYLVSVYKRKLDPYAYGKNFWEQVERMTPEKLIEIARNYLQPDEFKTIIVTSTKP